jgi:hypothetical protein
MKFATKLALVFSTIFFTVGLIVSLSVYLLNRATLEKAIKNDLQDIAFHTLDKIDRMLSERCGDIEILATDPVMISKSSTPKQITERLTAFRNIKKRYVSLSFFDLNRVCVADTSGIDIMRQHPLTGYWKDMVQGKDFAADISRSELLDEVVFHFAYRVRDSNGAARGVVVSRVPMKKLYEITRQAASIHQNIEKYLSIDLVDKNGRLV